MVNVYGFLCPLELSLAVRIACGVIILLSIGYAINSVRDPGPTPLNQRAHYLRDHSCRGKILSTLFAVAVFLLSFDIAC